MDINYYDTWKASHYIKGVRCDNESCYACATQRYNCKRLDQLDAESSRLI